MLSVKIVFPVMFWKYREGKCCRDFFSFGIRKLFLIIKDLIGWNKRKEEKDGLFTGNGLFLYESGGSGTK